MTLKGNHIDAFFRSFVHSSIHSNSKKGAAASICELVLFKSCLFTQWYLFCTNSELMKPNKCAVEGSKVSNEYFFCCLFSRKNKGNGIKGRRKENLNKFEKITNIWTLPGQWWKVFNENQISIYALQPFSILPPLMIIVFFCSNCFIAVLKPFRCVIFFMPEFEPSVLVSSPFLRFCPVLFSI